MRSDLTLTGVLPGLLRRGSPILQERGLRGERRPGVVTGNGSYAGDDGTLMHLDPGATLDLTDPTGRFHALLWLRERGHDLRWAQDEPEVLAWSVLSVARGGGPIVGIVAQRCWGSAGCPPGTTRYYMEREGDRAQIFYADVTRKTDERDAKIAEALAARYAIRNPDGSLTLPELPKVSP